ncbi:MAG TPA: acyloxyacyl hydrolase [Terriglobales bacterium]|nr:acyloxyacyl hydrolase [Terriglobales bacterium]
MTIPLFRSWCGICAALCCVLLGTLVAAQSGPAPGSTEIQAWTAGGYSVPGGRGHTGVWNAGFRYGWVLLGPHGPGFLRGEFEYAIDAVPLFLVFQPRNTAHGVGFNPLNLKWNFIRGTGGPQPPSELLASRVFIPYAELSGGVLFTDHTVPAFTDTINFTPSAALGLHILRPALTWTVEARYLHISNAGLERLNPGINTFEVKLGVGRFRK